MLASNEARSSRDRLQAQGEYLETVLGNLSAGVLTVDPQGVLVRLNRAAEQILQLPQGAAVDRPVAELNSLAPHLEALTAAITRQAAMARGEWQREILLERPGAPLVLLVRGSRLPASDGTAPGHVVVFDDVTILNQAQREAAWAEVARRMAHEVKNPLTPIRLAAERLRMKLMDKLGPRDAEMLDKSATTIVAQVEALRKLVDAFSDYAREPATEREPLQLDRLIEEVVELYRQGDPGLEFSLELCAGPADLSADSGQIRQLLHNLIRNATEAVGSGRHAQISIRTHTVDADGHRWLQMEVADHGPGYPAEVLAQPFEPYVTSKPKGSGLGLAICRKIVLDHNGVIRISNRASGGAMATVRLPLPRLAARGLDYGNAAEQRT
jgi:PAS domain S-box-containing protein